MKPVTLFAPIEQNTEYDRSGSATNGGFQDQPLYSRTDNRDAEHSFDVYLTSTQTIICIWLTDKYSVYFGLI